MAQRPKAKVLLRDIQGLRFLKRVEPLLKRLHDHRQHPLRSLHGDQYLALLLLYFFSPALDSLRGLQQATELKRIQKALGCGRAGLSTLSEAACLFPAEYVGDVVRALALELQESADRKLVELSQVLVAVDGTLLNALPRVTWALWRDDQHRAVKVHVHLDVLSGALLRADLTDANRSETAVLRQRLEPGRLYVIDGGYENVELMKEIEEQGSWYAVRLDCRTTVQVEQERELTDDDRAAGVVRDEVGRLGSRQDVWKRGPSKVRVVTLKIIGRDGELKTIRVATNLLDVSAEVVGIVYRYRWQVELFFRWMKCVLGCRHLLSDSANGIQLQIYAALIVSMLLVLYSGCKPTKRLFEATSFYLSGWATAEELEAIARREKMKQD